MDRHGIKYVLYTHPSLYTIDEALKYWDGIESVHCKNLFFRNHKGNRHYLVVIECHKDFDIHSFEHRMKEGKMSFASAGRMERCLGLLPGSVSPLGLIHDMIPAEGAQEVELAGSDGSTHAVKAVPGASPKELFPNGHRVKLFLDKDLQNAPKLSFHPCDNTASVIVPNGDFMRFLSIWGGDYEWIDVE
ncbi:MAG: prolyl-tRNA synthetase associated domain-containing protein [Bacteroidetes bacterium]|uniref:Prolyl-tRNA synthetase associated domain-containing protein n=1 Tax=Candidatus Cryptobacteroides avicola TaxID=2840757 RepID=A0A940DZ58_9BACT|nr:prolyl-tRNA synthetase associated domain-containing protein [Candidatus Cryptobacteroides avicola]